MKKKDEDLNLSSLDMMGEAQRMTLRNILSEYKIELSEVASRGALSLDVGEGPEIAALAQFSPNPFVATERAETSLMWGDSDRSLALVQQAHPSVRIIRDSVDTCLDMLVSERKTFGLITYLYMFPEDGGNKHHLIQSFTQIGRLLQPGGVMVASLEWVNEYESYGSNFFIAGYQVFRDTFHYFIEAPIIKGGTSAGGLFLVAQRPE